MYMMLKWFHLKYLLSIFTAFCLHHPIQMASIETIWELHTLTSSSCYKRVALEDKSNSSFVFYTCSSSILTLNCHVNLLVQVSTDKLNTNN